MAYDYDSDSNNSEIIKFGKLIEKDLMIVEQWFERPDDVNFLMEDEIGYFSVTVSEKDLKFSIGAFKFITGKGFSDFKKKYTDFRKLSKMVALYHSDEKSGF